MVRPSSDSPELSDQAELARIDMIDAGIRERLNDLASTGPRPLWPAVLGFTAMSATIFWSGAVFYALVGR